MLNLKDFIYESILGSSLEKEQIKDIKKLVKHPWEYFYKSTTSGMDFNTAIEVLISSLATGGAKKTKNISPIFPNKDQIILTVREEPDELYHTITFILGDTYKNRLSFTDNTLRYSNRTSDKIKMYKLRNAPTISTGPMHFGFAGSTILHQYILSKSQSKQLWDVLSMIYDKSWDNYWPKNIK